METLHNQTVFKCSYCTKISKSAAAMHSHEISCKKNPNMQYACPSCVHCERVETIGEEYSRCKHCSSQTYCAIYGSSGNCDNRAKIVDFVCKIDNAKMYAPRKMMRRNKLVRDAIISRCDKPMKNIAEGCENYEFNYGD